MSPPKQITHVVARLDGYGLTRQLELLVTQQLEAEQRVRVVALEATKKGAASLRQQGADCRVLDCRWRRDPFAATRLVGELRRHPSDIWHVWGQRALDYVRSIQGFVRSTRTLVSLPNATLLNSHLNGYVLPGIAAPNNATLSRRDFFAEQLLPEDSILIAVAGPLTRAQQIDEAIWYFELVRTLDERARLLIFGDGPDRHRLERFSRLASEPGAIRFLGYRTDFRELLSYADLFWQTAIPSKTLPLTVLEAMAAGVPVVVNDGPSCRQIIKDGNNGYLVPDKDRAVFARQTRRVLYDAKHADEFRNRAAQTITERFSVAAMTQAYAGLYAKALSQPFGD